MRPLQSNPWLVIQVWVPVTNFAIILKGQIMFSWDDFILRIQSAVIQCSSVSNRNSFQNGVICLKKLNQAQPWEQHWYSTNSDCGDWETLWLLTELIHGLNMADRDAFHQEIQSPDWLYDSKKQTSGSPQKRRWETGWSPNKADLHFFLTDITGESMTTSFISVQNEKCVIKFYLLKGL